MVKILLIAFLIWALYFLGKRYRHRLTPRMYAFGHGAAAVLTLGATLPASLLSRQGVGPGWRLGLAWAVASAALLYACWLIWRGDGVSAAAGSLQAGKYLLPALLGLLLLSLRTAARRLAQAQLPQQWNRHLERRALFFFFCGTGVWLMAAVLHAYLNDGFSNPSLAPWINNAYWLVSVGLLGWAALGEGRQYWMLRRLWGLRQQRRAAFSLDHCAQRAQRLFPGSWRRAVWGFARTWAVHQQEIGAIESVQLGCELWVFDRSHYVETLLAFLELPIYRARQRQACKQWLAHAFQLPDEVASALLERVETNTA
ncbi:MAG: hypothetical protein WCY07_13685 [Pigmentiphaga sp.]